MAFTVPTFNLFCDIYTVNTVTSKTLRSTEPCNLAMGKRITLQNEDAQAPGVAFGFNAMLLLPALTDIRDSNNTITHLGDIVEVVPGSGRWYFVSYVDDVGKGFSNEYRFASLLKIGDYGDWHNLGIPYWPTPIP